MARKKNIYVAASSQHVGKTTNTLGIVASFLSQGVNVGYCKPVGQQFVDIQNFLVDKDTLLFSDLINFEIDPSIHSPVILASGTSEKILEDPSQFDFDNLVYNARNKLEEIHDLIIYEGTGHPGVGTIANLSNARVAKMLDAGVIMIVEGGIGSTIDMINMSTALFRENDVPIIGLIINKILPEKMDKIKHYLEIYEEKSGIPILGYIPYDKTLAHPLVRTVSAAIKGDVIDNADYMNNPVENILAGSIVDLNELKESHNQLLLTSSTMADRAIQKVKNFSSVMELEKSPLSAIVITGQEKVNSRTQRYIDKFNIPVIRTNLDTYGVTVKLSRMEVKINRRTPWKINRAIELVKENIELDFIADFINK